MATSQQVQQLYLAYFGRPADAGGVSFYANASVNSVLAAFSASAESRTLYGSGSIQSQINAIYHNLFNRDAEAAGLVYWANAVQSGSISAAAAAYNILQGANNADSVAINNKLQVAGMFTSLVSSGYSGDAAAAAARDLLAGVDSTQTSVSTANTKITSGTVLKIIPPIPSTPGDYSMNPSGNNIHAGSADDRIRGYISYLKAGDVIDGGAGTDTLALIDGGSSGSYSLGVAQVINIERLVWSLGGSSTLDAQSVASLSSVEMDSGGTITAANNVNLVVDGGNSSYNTTLYVANTALAGSADATTLGLNSAGSGATVRLAAVTPTANEWETLNIVSGAQSTSPYTTNTTGANRITLATDNVQTSLATLNISGSAALNLAFTAGDHTASGITTIDASGASGGVTLGADLAGGVTLGAALHKVTLGAGNDTVFLGANLDGSDVVDGGAGTDTIGVSAAVSSMAGVRNVEVVRFDVSGQSITQDTSVPGMAGLDFSVVGGNSLTLNKLASGTTTTVLSSIAGLSESLRDASGSSDSLTLVLSGSGGYSPSAVTIGVVSGFAGVERLNIVTQVPSSSSYYGGGESTISSLQTSAALNFSGSGALNIGGVLQSTSVDASALTGNVRLQLGNSATTYKGGSGGDFLTLGGSQSVAHVISTGSGSDVITFTNSGMAANGSAADYSGFTRITDFAVGFDKINYTSSSGFSGLFVQSVAQNASVAMQTGSPFIVMAKLAGPVAFSGSVAATFAAAMGTSVLSHAQDTVVSMYDTTHGQMVLALARPSTAGSTTELTAADFTSSAVTVLGVLDMNALDYAAFGGNNVIL